MWLYCAVDVNVDENVDIDEDIDVLSLYSHPFSALPLLLTLLLFPLP